jgi:hypothetical protein
MTFEFFNTKFRRARWKQKQPFTFCYCVDNFYPEDIVWKKVSKLRSIAELRAFYGRHKNKMSSSKKLTCKGTLRQMFIRFHTLEMLVFSTQLWTVAHLTFSLVQLSIPPPPPPTFPGSTCSAVYKDSVVLGWVGVVESCWRPYSEGVCIWSDSETTKLLDHPCAANF